MVVGQTLGVSAGAGGVAELDLGMLLGSIDHEGLMAKAVSENDVAAFVDQIHSGVIALLTFGNVGLQDVVSVGQTQIGNSLLGAVDEVEVIGGVFIMQGDETNLHLSSSIIGFVSVVGGVIAAAAGHQAQSHDQSEDQRKELLHSCFPP